MKQPFQAIAWEMIRKHAPALLWIYLSIPLIGIVCQVYITWFSEPPRWDQFLISKTLEPIWSGLFFLPATFFCVLVFIFQYLETGLRQPQVAFPSRLFALPVSTLTLVLTPMLLGSAAITLCYSCWDYFVFSPLGLTLVPYHLILWFLLLTLVLFQSFFWLLAPWPRLRRFLLICGINAYVILVIFCVEKGLDFIQESDTERLEQASLRMSLFLVMMIGAVMIGTWVGLSRIRHGSNLSVHRLNSELFGKWSGRSQGYFYSPVAAQWWMEWRTHGWWLLGLGLAFTLPLAFAGLSEPSEKQIVVAAAIVSIMAGGFLGNMLANGKVFDSQWKLAPGLASKPLPMIQLVWIKLLMGLLIVTVVWFFHFLILGMGQLDLWILQIWVRGEQPLYDWISMGRSQLYQFQVILMCILLTLSGIVAGIVGQTVPAHQSRRVHLVGILILFISFGTLAIYFKMPEVMKNVIWVQIGLWMVIHAWGVKASWKAWRASQQLRIFRPGDVSMVRHLLVLEILAVVIMVWNMTVLKIDPLLITWIAAAQFPTGLVSRLAFGFWMGRSQFSFQRL